MVLQLKIEKSLFRLEEENEAIKRRITGDIRNFLCMKKEIIINL